MKSFIYCGVIAVSSLCFVATASAGDCKMIGAIGSGVSEGIARFMAEAGLKNLINDRNLTRQGEIKVTCSAGAVVTECSARQMACK